MAAMRPDDREGQRVPFLRVPKEIQSLFPFSYRSSAKSVVETIRTSPIRPCVLTILPTLNHFFHSSPLTNLRDDFAIFYNNCLTLPFIFVPICPNFHINDTLKASRSVQRVRSLREAISNCVHLKVQAV